MSPSDSNAPHSTGSRAAAAASFRGEFLIAMPNVSEGEFRRSVTLMCEHGEEGALGLVINRPSKVTLGDMLSQMGMDEAEHADADAAVYWGGPVQPERGFVVHSNEQGHAHFDASVALTNQLQVTSSPDVMQAIADGQGPAQFMVLLGYAGWGAGQLEQEVVDNTWLNAPGDPAIIFDTPAPTRWERAVQLLGVDISTLSGFAGHG